MDLLAVLNKLSECPESAENAKLYKELLDQSEATDSDALREFVDTLVKKDTEA